MQPSWVSAVKQLCSLLQQSEGRIKLLREIDWAVTDENVSLEELISRALRNLVFSVGASEGHVYVISGEELILLHSTGLAHVPVQLPLSIIKSVGVPLEETRIFTISTSDLTEAPEGLPVAEWLLFVPLHFSGDKCFAILVLESQSPIDPFAERTTSEFILTVAKQLSNAVFYRLEVANEKLINSLAKSFFEENLSPTSCYKTLAKSVCDFLPSYGPFRIDPAPQVQILTYDKNDDYLIIKATTGFEQDITRVRVKNSVCGLLVDEQRKPAAQRKSYILGHPSEFGNRYKSYLGKAAGQLIQTELAIPIYHEDELIGILNLESQFPNVFRNHHIDAMLKLCDNIAPIIHALKERTESTILQQSALGSALDNYLDHVGRLLRHGTATSATTVVGNLESIQKQVDEKSVPLKKQLEIIKRNFDVILRFVEEFRKNIVGFSTYRDYRISKIISKAVNSFNPEELAKQNILIVKKKGPDPYVYCSRLFEIHLYNLINNSKYSIEKRFNTGDDRPGRIIISVQKCPQPKQDQERLFNIRYKITIWDNGNGVSQKNLTQIKKFLPGYTTKTVEGGTGLGLYAAQKYMVSIGGWIDIDSKENEYFEVNLLLDKFNPMIHKRRLKFE